MKYPHLIYLLKKQRRGETENAQQKFGVQLFVENAQRHALLTTRVVLTIIKSVNMAIWPDNRA